MAFHGKKYKKVAAKVDRETLYTIEGALRFLKDNPTTKFDATAEIAFRLGVDPTKSDQAVRSTVTLPHGTGKKVRVLVFANGPAADAARAAGADLVGYEDLIAKVAGGFTEFDVAVATPDAMKEVRKLGKVLGPRGGEGLQGRPRGVPHGPQRQRDGAVRQAVLRSGRPARQLQGRDRRAQRGPAGGDQRPVHQTRHPDLDHGPRPAPGPPRNRLSPAPYRRTPP